MTQKEGHRIGGLTVREAATALGVTAQVIYLLAKRGTIHLVETDHGKRVPLAALELLRARWRR